LDNKINLDDHRKIGKQEGETEMYLGIEKGVVVDEMCEVILRLTAYAKEFNRGFRWADMSSSASEERK
jgi:hypothetical protein